MREAQIDVSGQEIMTLDKVTLRMNALVTYVIKDARRAVSAASDVRQSLYRDVQLALRAVVGARELDSFLTGKDDVAQELEKHVRDQATALGLGSSLGRHQRRDSAWGHEGPDESCDGSQEGCRSQLDRSSRKKRPRCVAKRTRRNCSAITRR